MKKRDHNAFVSNTISKLEDEGYSILQTEYTVEGLLVNNKRVRVDILCEKYGMRIPVECGKLRSPRLKRVQKLKEIFGILLHFPYSRENIIYIENSFPTRVHRVKPTPLIYREGYDDENFLFIEGFYRNQYVYKLRSEFRGFI